ncbi:hypothetical protein D9M71_708690 [compost metagenome]
MPMAALYSWVCTLPGAISVTRTPLPSRSQRKASQNRLTPALDAPYTAAPGCGARPALEPMKNKCPLPRPTMPGNTWRARCSGALRLMSSMLSISASSMSWNAARVERIPALLTSTSTACPSSAAASER